MAGLDVKSVLVIPLTILDKVRGFVSFEGHRHVRVLTESEEHARRSSSTILASALHRNATTRELIDTNIALAKNKNLTAGVLMMLQHLHSCMANQLHLVFIWRTTQI